MGWDVGSVTHSDRKRDAGAGRDATPAWQGAAPAAACRGWRGYALDAATASSLYLLAVVLLVFRIDRHPPYLYNWESHTAWGLLTRNERSTSALFAVDRGLMTESGQSPAVIGPIEVATALGLEGLTAMRVPLALLAGVAVPLLWIVGRRLAGHRAALLAALLLALSPVYLLYGRTATTVGISLVPALLTVYVLSRMLTGSWSWRSIVALQVLLACSAYVYAPIRFLWPISIVLLLIGIRFRPDQSRRYAYAAGITFVTLPVVLAVVFLVTAPDATPRGTAEAVAGYYDARGEHVIWLSTSTQRYAPYLGESVAADGSAVELAGRLMTRNAGDYLRLMLDHDTRPAITDHWNSRGSLYPAFLVPLFLIGFIRTARRAWRAPERALLLALFLGLGLPMLLTSKVHVGRLILTLPLLCLFVAIGLIWSSEWVARQLGSRVGARGQGRGGGVVVLAASVGVVLIVAWSTVSDFYRTDASPTSESLAANRIRSVLAEPGDIESIVLVAGEPLVSALRMSMRDELAFVDVGSGRAAGGEPDDVPVLYYGMTVEQLRDTETAPNGCDAVYVVHPRFDAIVQIVTARWADICGRPPRAIVLDP